MYRSAMTAVVRSILNGTVPTTEADTVVIDIAVIRSIFSSIESTTYTYDAIQVPLEDVDSVNCAMTQQDR